MKNKKNKKTDEKVKVVIMNPERIPVAAEKLTKFLYDEYMRKISSEETGKITK